MHSLTFLIILHHSIIFRNDFNFFFQYVGIDYDVAMTVAEEVFAPLFGMTAAQLKAILDSGVTVLYGVDLRAYIMYDNPYEAINYCNKPLMRAFDYPGANETYPFSIAPPPPPPLPYTHTW